MANSFLQSLPSRKKKRKLRHRERCAGSQTEHHSQKSPEHHEVNRAYEPATQPTSTRSEIEEIEGDESLLSESESCSPGTELQNPIAALKTRQHPQDEETVGMYSPLSGEVSVLDSNCAVDSVEKGGGAADDNRGNESQRRQINLPFMNNGKEPAVGPVPIKQQCGRGSSDQYSAKNEREKHLSSNVANNRQSIRAPFEDIESRRYTDETSERNTEKTATRYQMTAAPSETNQRPKYSDHDATKTREAEVTVYPSIDVNIERKQTPKNRRRTTVTSVLESKTEWFLTSTDIRSCITEIKAASNTFGDHFADVDLASFQTALEKFERYLVSLLQPSSNEAAELEKLFGSEQTFAIFESGIGVNHCNVCFICDMIDDIAREIEELEGDATKLRGLTECMDLAFGVDRNKAEETNIFLSVSETGGVVKLTFKSDSTVKPSATEASIQQASTTLPPHLDEVSKIFEQYTYRKVQPLQTQLDSIRSTLSKTREGAMRLQKSALDLQNQSQLARIETEEAESRQAELESTLNQQRIEFKKRLDSSERVKEHYKRLLEQKEKELLEARGQIQREAAVPDAAHSMASVETSPRKRIEQARSEKEEGVSRATNRNRISIEPPVRFMASVETSPRKRIHSEKEEDVSRATNRNRISIEPPVRFMASVGTSHRKRIEQAHSEKKEDVSRATNRNRISIEPPVRFMASVETSHRKRIEQAHNEKKEDVSRATNINRISIEPPDGKDEDKIHESPPVLPPIKNYGRHDSNNQRSYRSDSENDRNPLGSLTVNGFLCHPTSDETFDDKLNQDPARDGRSESKRPSAGKPTKRSIYPSKKRLLQVENLNTKKPRQESNDSDRCDFKYQEVVRGKHARAALPAFECEACRKFNDAIYAQTGSDMPGREQMIKECSRHRARFQEQLTPAGFWNMDFVDET